jgi:hypothetical protein
VELDELFDRARSWLGIALVRDRRYLTWRFAEAPLAGHRFVLARRRGRLSGYLVYRIAGNQLLVKDWLGEDARAVRALFCAAIDVAVSEEVASASVTLLESHRDRGVIRGLGFAVRPETSTSITYAAECLPWRAEVMSKQAWYMTVGDRDV